MNRLTLGAVSALVLAGAAAVAVAQTPPAPTAPDAPQMRQERRVIIQRGPGLPADRFEMRRQHRMARPEDRAERLRTMLQLTPGQEGALQSFLTTTTPPKREDMVRPAVAERGPQTAVERADRMAEMTARIAADTRKRADATRTFYAALTPSQRKVFDTTAGMDRGPMMRIRERRIDGMPPGPPAAPAPPRPPAPPKAG